MSGPCSGVLDTLGLIQSFLLLFGGGSPGSSKYLTVSLCIFFLQFLDDTPLMPIGIGTDLYDYSSFWAALPLVPGHLGCVKQGLPPMVGPQV